MDFPGECGRCGAPNVWSYDRHDEIWIRCSIPECQDDQLELLPVSEPEWQWALERAELEPGGADGVVALEGREAKETER